MSTELWILIASVALAMAQAGLTSTFLRRQAGNAYAVGPRDQPIAPTGMAGRMERAYRNLLESLPWFAIVVLTAHVTSHNNGLTETGAHLYFWARLLYVPAYASGIPWVRTGFWWVSGIGIVLIAVQLF